MISILLALAALLASNSNFLLLIEASRLESSTAENTKNFLSAFSSKEHSKNYKMGDPIELKVNAMTSTFTQIPKPYYNLPFCKPKNGPKAASGNLGDYISKYTGNKIQTSPYEIIMMKEEYCKILCQIQLTSSKAVSNMRKHVLRQYNHNWIVDGLPSAHLGSTEESGIRQTHYSGGFPIGFVEEDSRKSLSSQENSIFIYNHVNLIFEYHQPSIHSNDYNIVGFSVEPMSIRHAFLGGFQWDGKSDEVTKQYLSTCAGGIHIARKEIQSNQIVARGENILFTYDVLWRESDVPWSSRWDIYLTQNFQVPGTVHQYSLKNNLMIVIFLTGVIMNIIVRKLRRDIASYDNTTAVIPASISDGEIDDEEILEHDITSATLPSPSMNVIAHDVFRPPSYPMLYSIIVGSGCQITITIFACIFLSALGFIRSFRPGSLIVALVSIYMVTGCVAGYISSRLYKTFNGRSWQVCALLTATMFPSVCFGIFLFFNITLAFYKSSGSIPLLDIMFVVASWYCIYTPLVFGGTIFGRKKAHFTYPTSIRKVERKIPPPTLMVLHPYTNIVIAGLVPFAAIYVELFFTMTRLWMHHHYSISAFSMISFLLFLIACAEVTFLLIYYQLCAENHKWWWFSLFSSGSVAGYIFCFSVIWFEALGTSRLTYTFMLYFGYSFLISFALFLMTGAFGALSSLWFLHRVYSTIKVD